MCSYGWQPPFPAVLCSGIVKGSKKMFLWHKNGINNVFTTQGIYKTSMLHKLTVWMCPNSGAIPNAFLKCYASQLADSFTSEFQFCLVTGEVPDDWNSARIVSIHKKGNKIIVWNYLFISITCACGKLLECVVAGYIRDILNVKGILSPHQHGFRKGMSTVVQLVTTVHEVSIILFWV